jgi:tetratricopeptide (TPR) repeat protein
LEAAIVAYHAALQERTRDKAPLGWAMTQNNLGVALEHLGERKSGTADLDAAVAAYRAALQELTRDQMPLGWAATQNNLGWALERLGERESGTADLKAAVAAWDDCLAVVASVWSAEQVIWMRAQRQEAERLIAARSAK